MKSIILAIGLVSVVICEVRALPLDARAAAGPSAASDAPPKHTAEEERALRLALDFARKRSPQLTYSLLDFKAELHDAAAKVWEVHVRGTMPKGSRYSTGGFRVLVHSNGTVTIPFWSIDCGW